MNGIVIDMAYNSVRDLKFVFTIFLFLLPIYSRIIPMLVTSERLLWGGR